jgi:hypothetical protein
MGTYIYAITKTEYDSTIMDRVGVLEFLFKPFINKGETVSEQTAFNRVLRRWENKSLPRIVRMHGEYYVWESASPFWQDDRAIPAKRVHLPQSVSK